ncbi:MAG TPA: 4-hydroxy-tetrahydrodipicolinate reductase [Candidatus Methanoperedenaceae archaeon]|nr:4-hydroxy-tetrahydrodipicolinate reductase [Candidatus Methanoperedenaceae archaeon]
MIRVAVTGACGRMGTLIIQNVLSADDMKIVAGFDLVQVGEDIGNIVGGGPLGINITHPDNLSTELVKTKTDVLIDFTIAYAAVKTIETACKSKTNLVVGTTGFTPEQQQQNEENIKKSNTKAVIAPNFSIGVNVFLKLIEKATKHLQNYDIEIIEAHHNQKKDAPSGTAIKAAEIINQGLTETKPIIHGRQGLAPRESEIAIHAIRGGDIVGDHTVLFAGNGERIEIKHQAHSRQTFAAGAITAARWLSNERISPGLYGMKDILNL